MKSFNRERFLFLLFAGLLTYQATLFGFALVKCSTYDKPREHCPEIGSRWDKFMETTTAAVLGLIAGSAAIAATSRSASNSKEDEEPPTRTGRVRRADPQLGSPKNPIDRAP